MAEVKIKELWIYPVKSMQGIQLKVCPVNAEGLENDRQWMLIDADNNFISQRKIPKLALYKASLNGETLCIEAPNNDAISVLPSQCTSVVSTTVWGSFVKGLVAPAAVNHWLTTSLSYKTPLRLIYRQKDFRRTLATDRFGNHTTAFADAAPLLIANKQSLIAMNAILPKHVQPLTMRRLRPNIVIDGINAFEEHHFKTFFNESAQIQLIDHCQRCSIITVNPTTGQYQHASEIFEAISTINPMPNSPKAPAFGVNAIYTHQLSSTLTVGSSLFAAH